jgi:hypothetical protein
MKVSGKGAMRKEIMTGVSYRQNFLPTPINMSLSCTEGMEF